MSTISRAAQFAERTAHLRASTIREMLKVTQQPDVISFGGGLPAPELFPTAEIAEATQVVMEHYGPAALQYSVTEGIPEMRRWVADRLNARFDRNFDSEAVTIVNGSQQGLDLVGKVFLDPGDHVVLEDPSYLGAIQAFDAYQSRYLTVDTDEEGLIPESLERVLERADPFPKFLYLVPNFQNPTGRTLSRRRRELVVRICEHFGLPIVEDDPYGELRFEGENLPSLISLETTAPIIYLGTASKIMAPGMRIAWLLIDDEEIREKIVLAKQGADLHSGTFAQYVFHQYARDDRAFDAHVKRIARTYSNRRGVMSEALSRFMPDGVRFTRPAGGMFLWVTVPGVDTTELLQISARSKVVFVPGVNFYPGRNVHDGMRLNFSNASEKNIEVGVERLGHAIRAYES
ncbi:MAG TPA: PLP-dependent aminotransferase family protein [Candidatus Baltobacteraceae bacterium]|jgi:2-aminoadipate transaminase|nr:PLP-dependent aminotransferase family protein [Candidatus Baltobacteraceae bacterium]